MTSAVEIRFKQWAAEQQLQAMKQRFTEVYINPMAYVCTRSIAEDGDFGLNFKIGLHIHCLILELDRIFRKVGNRADYSAK